MCGICGIFFKDRSRQANRKSLAAMNRAISHRGPDDEGYFVEQNVGLAMRRLSIIDVSTGHQPLTCESQDKWIVFNGEIYNHRDLRKDLEARGHRYRTQSDTETVIHAYEEYGADCVNRLRGMFAFVVWDQTRRLLFAARDRLGIKPFYYFWDGSSFLFGSEIKAILAHPNISAELNRRTLAEYLAFGYITGESTMFRGIRKLMPGHVLQVSETDQLEIRRYWDLPTHSELEQGTRKYYVDTYRQMLESAVRSHLMSDVPLGTFLSGGLDSSAVAAMATKIGGERIKTFAVGYGADDQREAGFSELTPAREVANHIRSDHHEVYLGRDQFFKSLPLLIWHEDEPIAWPSSVSLFSVAQLARNHVKVVLTGEGSDETLAGYTRYAWTLANARMGAVYRSATTTGFRSFLRYGVREAPLGASLRRKLEHTFLARDGNSWPSFYYDNFFSAIPASQQAELLTPMALEECGDAYAGSMSAWGQSQGDLLHRMLHADINTYLIELLMKQDQMSMAASIESRVPFLDHELVEFTAKIPARYLVRGLAGKIVLKEAVRDLLPPSIVHRKKRGFPTPWEHWLVPMLDGIETFVVASRSVERGLFRPEALQTIFAEHRTQFRDHGTAIWRLLNLEVWQRVFFDGEDLLSSPDLGVQNAAAG